MKNSNLLLYFLITISLLPDASTCTASSNTIYMPTQSIQPIDSKNSLFLWDFHDVIVKRNMSKTISAVWHSDKKFQIIKSSSLGLLWRMLALAVKSVVSHSCSEELVQTVKQYHNQSLEQLIYEIGNIQEPIAATVILIQELSARGYQHYIGSNIGASIFKELINPTKYPQFADLFSHFNLEFPQTVSFDPAHPEKTLKKPDPKFYEEFLENNKIDLKTTNVIFIDDRLKNVLAAQKMGMIGIHFKNPEQLRADLNELGIASPANSAQPTLQGMV